MGKKSIWVTRKQMRNRALFFVIAIVAILIILAIVFSNVKHEAETKEEATPVVEEQQQVEQKAEPGAETEILGPEEEPLEADCVMKIKHAEDELLDAYKIQKAAKEEVRRLEEQIEKANQKVDESNAFVKMAQEALNEAKECSE
jgi:peptidoglycan hydrolase CwlO-like protein